MRFAYLGEDNDGWDTADMIAFFPGCPELSHKSRTMRMFRLSCLCLEHVVLGVPKMKFGSSIGFVDGLDLTEIIKPVQKY